MPDTPAVDTARAAFQSIAVDQIKLSRHQARKVFDEEAIKGLAESMKQETLLQPITVRQAEDGYELISGERRLRASKLLGWATIDAKVIQTVSEGEAAAKGLIENLQREDLNPIEEAQGFQDLLDLKDSHWNQERISEAVGKSPTYVSESLLLLKLPDSIKEKFCRQNFSRSLGVELARLPGQDVQLKAAESIEGLNRNQAREVLKVLKGPSSSAKNRSKPAKKLLKDAYNPRGIQFKGSGRQVIVSIPYDRTKDLEVFLDGFKEEMTLWCRQHPYTATAEDVAAKTKEQEDYKAYVAKSDAYEKELAERQAYLAAHPKPI